MYDILGEDTVYVTINNSLIKFVDYIFEKLNYDYGLINFDQLINFIYYLERLESLEVFS